MRLRRRKALADFTYLVTKDVTEALERKFGYALAEDAKERINFIEDRFLREFWAYIPGSASPAEIDAACLSRDIELEAGRSKYPVVSLDRIYMPNADRYLEVTRITNPKTGKVTIGPRPGSIALKEQVSGIRALGKISLADVGMFDGNTLLEICSLLEGCGIEIGEIYLGISGNEAYRRISGSRRVNALNLFDLYEWVELRDFFGIDGRNVGASNGKRRFMPYWENLSGWASISSPNERCVERMCKRYNKMLLEVLEEGGFDMERIGDIEEYEAGKLIA
ncbi:MAG: hypothetical protein HYT73_01800 [Candidatus Aenigmarchaeota archaeon]|nr:hypothetical protein [Candidatus Aenigmarchaeota archaeon]